MLTLSYQVLGTKKPTNRSPKVAFICQNQYLNKMISRVNFYFELLSGWIPRVMMSRPMGRPNRSPSNIPGKYNLITGPKFYDFHIRCECLKINIYSFNIRYKTFSDFESSMLEGIAIMVHFASRTGVFTDLLHINRLNLVQLLRGHTFS